MAESAVPGTFARADDDQRRHARWAIAASRISTVLMILALLAICTYALRQLWIEWQTASAQPLDLWLMGLFFALWLLLMIWNAQSKTSEAAQTSELRQRVQVVRCALLAGDTQLAPLAAAQPEPSEPASIGDESVTIGPLRPLTDTQVTLPAFLAAIELTFGLVATMVAAIFLGLAVTQPNAHNNPPLWLDGGASLLAVVLLAIGIRGFARSMHAGGRQPVAVDNLGVRWARRRDQPPMPWGDARAFYTVTASGSSGEMFGRRIYVLDSGDQVFTWQRTDNRFDHTLAASDQLLALISGRTSLPLRDLTLAFDQVTTARSPGSPQTTNATRARMLAQIERARERRHGLNPQAEARLAAFIARVTPPDTPDTRQVSAAVRRTLEAGGMAPTPPKNAAGAGCQLMLAAVIAFAVLAGAAWSLQQVQVRYLAGLPARIHAETPLHADSLAAPDGTWLVSGAAVQGVHYQDQTYRLTGTAGNIVTAWTPVSYGDVAVQVTARQLGGTQSDGVGLIVRADAAGDDYVAFVVSPTDGSWTLWQYHPIDANPDDDWHYLAGGDSAAIHTGPGAANTLLSITRGQTYVLYINGVFVGSASDGDTDVYGNAPTIGTMTTPRQGYAGVYLADGITVGVFSDFVVYPVQSPPSLWYV